MSVNKTADFIDLRFELSNVVLDSISVGVGRMEVIDEFACC